MDAPDDVRHDVAAVGAVVFESLVQFRARLVERIHEVNAMTEREVMGAADDVHAIFGAASEQIARLRKLLRGNENQSAAGPGVDELTSLIDGELKGVALFATELNREVTEQLRLTRAVEKSLSEITVAASQVGTFANRAKMLALNARIEASRDSGSGTSKGFAVIADQMKDLSRGVAETNASIQALALSVAALLPGIIRGANLMHENSKTFSGNLQQVMRTIAERSGERRKEIAGAVEQSDATLSRIVSSSQSALSHLQFQDAVAQGLMRLDGMLAETQRTLCDTAGLEDSRTQIAPPLHSEIGGDKVVDQREAGKVLLF